MALDLSGGAPRVRPGTRILVWCAGARPEPRVAGLPLWKRAVYTACRAGFERLVVVAGGAGAALERELAGDARLEGRTWEIVAARDWSTRLREEGGRWVVLADAWVVDAELLAELAAAAEAPVAAGREGPFAADAADLARWAEAGWSPASAMPTVPAAAVARPPVYVRVATPDDARRAEAELFRGLARNAGNFFARHVDRAMSRAISRVLAPWPVTPNQITIFSTLLGIVGSLVMLHPSYAAGALGAFLFFAHTVVDGCDGEIARLKFQESAFGAKLDLIGDNVVHAFLFPCLAARCHLADPSGPFLLLGAVSLAGVVVTWIVVYSLVVRGTPSPLVLRTFELFANREFAYLVLVLGLAGRLEWFVWAMAVGLWAFPAALLAARAWERTRRAPRAARP